MLSVAGAAVAHFAKLRLLLRTPDGQFGTMSYAADSAGVRFSPVNVKDAMAGYVKHYRTWDDFL
ncbi:MAG: hypothetical protein NTW87_19255 [Planctomycetota bacterium]|nr:hypothetical protein [Planctomycetota bacterium]